MRKSMGNTINLRVKIGKLELKNPIIAASGTFGYGEEFHENFYDISKLGAVVTKGISLKPRKGNPTPRVVETASGMLNAIGLQNVGLKVFLKEKLPFLKKSGATVIVNIFGEKAEEYGELAQSLDDAEGVHAIELNISCPNVRAGGIQFGIDPKLAERVVKVARKSTQKTIIVKLSPNCSNIPLMAETVADAGADVISLINTITGMAVNAETRRPVLANITGGLSGPAIKPVALRMVWEAYKKAAAKPCPERSRRFALPIIGLGGIMNVTDVVEFMLAGSTAVQVGTASFIDPNIGIKLVNELRKYLIDNKISDVNKLTGALIV